MMQSSHSRRSLLNYAGIAILVAGLAAGEFIYWRGLRQGADSQNAEATARLADSKVYDYEVRTQVGTLGAIMIGWENALEKLGEPGPLAVTICVASAIAAGGCFMAARRMPRN